MSRNSLSPTVQRVNAVSLGNRGRRWNSGIAEIRDTPQQGCLLVTMLMVVPMMVTSGPIARYKQLVETGRLREDSHQKGTESISVAVC
jgi:hypothetical protein